MKKISRILVLLFALILTQSSLGTNYARADFSNVVTKSLGQNGYYKFPDGLLLQYGKAGSSTAGNLTVYFPTTFYDSNYSLNCSMMTDEDGAHGHLYAAMPWTLYSSYFKAKRRWAYTNSQFGDSALFFFWFAIGRWK